MAPPKNQYLVRSAALSGFTDLVESLNGDVDALLKKSNLSKEDFKTPDAMIPYSAMVMLLEVSAKTLNVNNFALRLAATQNFQMLGPLGLLLQTSNTPREAFILVQRYMAIHNYGENWRLKTLSGLAIIERQEVYHSVNHARQNKELSIAVFFHFIKLLIGPHVKIKRIEFAHAPLSQTSYYRQLFECEVVFNQEQDRILLNSHYLDQPIQTVTSTSKQTLESYVAGIMNQYDDDIERQIKSLILQTLGLQQHNIDNIAAMLNIHKRTLQRRLAESQLNFKTILSDVRMNTACWHLKASTMDITLLSEMLGYSDVSAFSRAFKSRKGCSPLQWRQQQLT